MTLKKVISSPTLLSCGETGGGMRRSKSDSNLQIVHLNRKQLKSIVFLKKKISKEGKLLANGIQDVQFANEICDSHDLLRSVALTALMVYSMENDEDKIKRIKLIVGTVLLLELMKHT